MFTILLQLGALMGGNGILERQFVQAEFFAQLGDRFAVG
jgi:hypothetical protein